MVNGEEPWEKEGDFSNGLMALGTIVNGKKENIYVEKENFGMLMAISSKENGRMTKQTDTEFIYMSMEQNMKEIGRMTYKTVMVLRRGQMVRNMKGTIRKAKNMVRELTLGVMDQNMMDSGLTIK